MLHFFTNPALVNENLTVGGLHIAITVIILFALGLVGGIIKNRNFKTT
jgi:uncharacterized membrane protein